MTLLKLPFSKHGSSSSPLNKILRRHNTSLASFCIVLTLFLFVLNVWRIEYQGPQVTHNRSEELWPLVIQVENVTAFPNIRNTTLFFNRVPKVGSQTLMNLIRKLGERNWFQFHKDGTQKVETIKLSFYEESRLTTMVDMFPPPAAYAKHTCFSDFEKHGHRFPIYINFVRDPIERVISWFYYIRAPWYIVERRQAFPELPLPHPKWLKKDFDSCVLSGDKECQFIPGQYHDGVGDHRRQAMFFCGHAEECVEFNGAYALAQAKANVEKHYSVVGVLEEMDLSLKVLEAYIPFFFSGASDVFYKDASDRENGTHINKNIYKPPVSEKVKNILRQNFTREIEFYEFCKQRLHKQWEQVEKSKSSS